MKIYQPRLARLQVLALRLAAQAVPTVDPAAFEALAVTRTSRDAAVQRISKSINQPCTKD